MQKLSIIIPVYNEAATVIKVFEKIRSVELIHGIEKQLVVVNDASTDNSADLIKAYMAAHPDVEMTLTTHEKNAGKGAAIHTGIEKATGDFVIIQDADLEYDPNDYNRLLQPIMDGAADIVYGSRFVGGHPHRILFFWHSLGNKILTFFSNMFTNLNLTDMEIGYKLFRADIIKSIPLEEKRFGFEPEITAKIARLPGVRIYEVGISYYGRTYQEGKKINWKDGVRAFYSIIKYNAFIKKKQPAPVKSADKLGYLVTALFFMAGLILMFTASGTYDEGDSVMHYLYARHAFEYPEFFFYHWAKPVYTLFAAPFAQSGFNGIRLFNLLVSCGSLLLTFRLAKKIGLPNAWLAPLCTAAAPLMMIVTFSGLTEPLFALWLMIGFNWLADKKYFAGFLWISFLPFVRSEGLVIICILLVYAFFVKAKKYIPLLAVGHIAYSLAGYFMGKDFLWVFTDITYATLDGVYGDGAWNEYLVRWPEVSGVILTLFLVLGLIYGAIRFAGRFIFFQKHAISNTELFLVYATFVGYVVAHAIFWALGIFNSAGLIRVMMPVIPLAGIICARGINFITMPVDVILKSKKLLWFSVVLILLYPFLPHHYQVEYKKHYALKADQVAELRLAKYMKEKFPDYKNHMVYFEACYLSVALDINYFDSTKHRRLIAAAFEENRFPSKCFIVWEDWFARTHDVPYEKIEADGRFQWLGTFTEKDIWGVKRVAKVYRKKD